MPPRTDVTTAHDLKRVIVNEVIPTSNIAIIKTPDEKPFGTREDARVVRAYTVAHAALEHEMIEGEVPRYRLAQDQTHFNRLKASIERARQTERFR